MFASFIYFLGHLQGALWSSAPCAGLSPYRCHRLGLSTLCVIWYLFLPPSLRWLLRCILDMFIFWSLCQFVLWLSACVARFLVAPPTSCGGSVPGCCGGCRRVLFIECSLHNLCGVTLRPWWPLVRFFFLVFVLLGSSWPSGTSVSPFRGCRGPSLDCACLWRRCCLRARSWNWPGGHFTVFRIASTLRYL